MLFSLKHLLPAIGVLTLLRGTIARSALVVDNDDLIERREMYGNAQLNHELVDCNLVTRADLLEWRAPPKLSAGRPKQQLPKSTQFRKEAKASPYTPKRGKPEAEAGGAQPKAPGLANGKKALPTSAKLIFSKGALEELDGMGLHGTARKNTIKWHKNQVKMEMRTNPLLNGKAKLGVIKHVAHKGGTDPKEKNHITASFYDKNKIDISNNVNGRKNHHIFVNNKGLNRQAKAASAKSDARIKGQSRSHQTSVGRTQTPRARANTEQPTFRRTLTRVSTLDKKCFILVKSLAASSPRQI